jgi:MoaA/NifB/PqqE/SkfB family radical SAM enzyme
MEIGFALTQHCNLRCPHCIRDDVTTVQSLSVELLASILAQSRALFGSHSVSFTGGEPLLHPEFGRVVDLLAEYGHPYRFVSNGWHLTRALAHLDRHAPSAVRLSLSGATAAVHDAERGRGSFHRVLLASGVLTSRGIPTHLSLVIDSRTRGQLREAADLAESIGAHELHYILPQPVAASVMRDSDLPLEEWDAIRDEVDALAAEGRAHVRIVRDYGFPADGAERPCTTKARTRLFVDAWGRLVSCCQLSDYGFNDAEVVTDLHVTPLTDALDAFNAHVDRLIDASAPRSDALVERFPCLRCARANGKLRWLTGHARSPWAPVAVGHPERATRVEGTAFTRSSTHQLTSSPTHQAS